jgi:prolipoprotein diacylglyceryltransferase
MNNQPPEPASSPRTPWKLVILLLLLGVAAKVLLSAAVDDRWGNWVGGSVWGRRRRDTRDCSGSPLPNIP